MGIDDGRMVSLRYVEPNRKAPHYRRQRGHELEGRRARLSLFALLTLTLRPS